MDDRDLDFEVHLGWFDYLGYAADDAEREAQCRHAEFVLYALARLYTDTAMLGSDLNNQEARYYMLYGASRRLGMMLWSYKAMISTVPPGRSQPLAPEEQHTLSRDINIIYMNARGVLDNFAWCFLYEKEPKTVAKLHPINVSLFSRKIRELTDFPDFWLEIDQHQAWAEDLKERRDPVAHRIPLYVPPSALTPEEQARYGKLAKEHIGRAVENDFEGSEEAFRQMHEIGQFLPCFVHHPEAGIVPIYPTVPTDMAHLVRLGRTVRDHIK